MLNLSSLNQRVNALASKINNIPVPPPADDLSAVLTAGNSAGSNNIDMNSNNINNVSLINGSVYPPAPPATPALSAVLTAGDNAGGLNITNLNDLGVTTINGSVYPPAVDTLSAVLTAGNTANNTIVLTDGVSNIVNTIADSGLTLTSGVVPTNRNITISSATSQYVYAFDNISPTIPFASASQTSIIGKDEISNQLYITDGVDSINNIAKLEYDGDVINAPFSSKPKLTLDRIGTGSVPNNKIEIMPEIINVTGGVPNQLTIQTNGGQFFMDSEKTYIGLGGFQARDSAVPTEQATLSQQGVLATFVGNDWYSYYRASSAFIGNVAGTIGTLIQSFGLITILGNALSQTTISSTDLTITNSNVGSAGSAVLRGLGRLTLTSQETGGSTNASLSITNNSASGAVYNEFYKNKTSAGIAGEPLLQESVFGKDSFNVRKEYTRITHTIRDPTGGLEDGSIEMGCLVNGAFTNLLQLNGNENEINMLRPLDMNGNNVRTTTGSMAINVASSSTAGATLTLATKDNVAGSGAGLLLTGNTLLSGSSGGSSGQHLCLTIGGSVYKIKLENP